MKFNIRNESQQKPPRKDEKQAKQILIIAYWPRRRTILIIGINVPKLVKLSVLKKKINQKIIIKVINWRGLAKWLGKL